MTVFVLEPDGSETSVNRIAASVGFGLMGEEVRPFARGDFEALPIGPGDIVVGGIGLAHRAFERVVPRGVV